MSLPQCDADAELREQAERRSIEQLCSPVFGVSEPQERRFLRMETNPRHFQLANPGRQFEPAYLADIGVDASLLQAPGLAQR